MVMHFTHFKFLARTYVTAGDIQWLIFLKEEPVHQKAVSCKDSCSFSSLAAQDQYKVVVTHGPDGERE